MEFRSRSGTTGMTTDRIQATLNTISDSLEIRTRLIAIKSTNQSPPTLPPSLSAITSMGIFTNNAWRLVETMIMYLSLGNQTIGGLPPGPLQTARIVSTFPWTRVNSERFGTRGKARGQPHPAQPAFQS